MANHGINFDACDEIEFVAFGPIFSEGGDAAEHQDRRNRTAALERDLWQAMSAAGYRVLNTVHSLKASGDRERATIVNAFAESFPRLLRAI